MPVGATMGFTQMNNIISSLAVQIRDVMQNVSNTNLSVNGQGAGLAYLESIGYDSLPNAANPGGISDAQYALNMISYLNTIAAVYFGDAAQTPAFDFHQQLSQLWAAQVA